MKKFYRWLLICLITITFILGEQNILFSQTPNPVLNQTKNGTYEKIACSQLGDSPELNSETKNTPLFPTPLFPIPATEEGKDYECGTLTVPERHSEPNGKTITVGVVIIKSSNPNPAEPLVMFQGGPGGSSVSIFSSFASPDDETGKMLRADRDLIIFDKRGNRYSKPWLRCPELKLVSNSNENDALEDRLKATKACRDRLTKSGVNLAAFNSVESAHDVAVLVNSLGYKKVNLYGVSYGTELVFNIMREHPEIIRSVIVDGIVPPNPSIDSQYAVILDRLINNIDQACATDTDCNELYPDLKQVFEETFKQLNQTPASIQVIGKEGIKQESITGIDFASVLFQMAYSSGAPFVMPAMIYQVHDHEYSLITQFYYLNALLEVITDDLADGTYFSVKCSEDKFYADRLDVGGVSNVAKDWGMQTFQEIEQSCQVWNVPAVKSSDRDLVVSDIPSLLFNGNFDPITPPPFGKLVAQGLSNNTNVIFPANGHGAIMSGSCAAGIMTKFLNRPKQSLDTSCTNKQEISFITKKNTLIAPGTNWLAQSLFDLAWRDVFRRLVLLILLIVFPLVWFIIWLFTRTHDKGQLPKKSSGGARWATWIGTLVAIFSASWIVLQLVQIGMTATSGGHGDLGFTRIFVGVDRSFAWVYAIPILIAFLSLIMAIMAVLSWKHYYWGKGRRFYYSFTAGAAIAYSFYLAMAGQLTIFFQ